VTAKEQTLWMKNRLVPYSNYRVETWIEKYRTSTVHMGHKLVEPSKGTVIATAKVVVAIQNRDGSSQVIPERDRLQRLIDTDVECQGDPHALYDAITTSTCQRNEPFVASPFVIGPGDIDDLGEVNQSAFIKWMDQARFEHTRRSMNDSRKIEVTDLLGISTCALEYVNTPSLGAEVTSKLWLSQDTPLSCIVEMSDTASGKMYCRVVADARPEDVKAKL